MSLTPFSPATRVRRCTHCHKACSELAIDYRVTHGGLFTPFRKTVPCYVCQHCDGPDLKSFAPRAA